MYTHLSFLYLSADQTQCINLRCLQKNIKNKFMTRAQYNKEPHRNRGLWHSRTKKTISIKQKKKCTMHQGTKKVYNNNKKEKNVMDGKCTLQHPARNIVTYKKYIFCSFHFLSHPNYIFYFRLLSLVYLVSCLL